MKNCFSRHWITAAAAFLFAVGPLMLTGCDRKEEVLDVETPEGELEVERDPETGATDIETEE